ncbi:MAG: N-6 DNA methylase, partial [Aeromonadaceae bacterium]
GRKGDLAIYGQELMAETRKLCLMNLAVHGLDGDLGESYGSTFTNDQHKTLRADYILANPPLLLTIISVAISTACAIWIGYYLFQVSNSQHQNR